MEKRLLQCVSLILVGALAADPTLAAFVPSSATLGRSSNLPHKSVERFSLEALSLLPLSEMHFPFRPFRSFSNRLKGEKAVWVAGAAISVSVIALLWHFGITVRQGLTGAPGIFFVVATFFSDTPPGSPSNHSNSPSIVRAALQAASEIYGKRQTATGSDDLLFCDAVAKEYLRLTQMANLKPEPYTWAAIYFSLATDQELKDSNKLQSNEKTNLLALAQRINHASHISYTPPEDIFDESSNPLLYQMGQILQATSSVHEVMSIIALRMVTLRALAKNTAERRSEFDAERIDHLYRELREVYGPLMYFQAMPSVFHAIQSEATYLRNPEENQSYEDLIQKTLGISRRTADKYLAEKVGHIQESLAPLKCRAAYTPVKSAGSLKRKLHSKPKAYTDLGFVQDFFRFSVVLDHPEQLEAVVEILKAHFLGVHSRLELKKAPGLQWHDITFTGDVHGKPQSHEVHIFLREADFFKFHYGPSGWASYDIYQMTGKRPQPVLYDVRENDPEGNFLRMKETLSPWTYFSRLIKVRKGRPSLLMPDRVPRFEIRRGNVADMAAVSRKILKTIGAVPYTCTFDIRSGIEFLKGRKPVTLDYVIHPGDVIEPIMVKAPVDPDPRSLEQMENTAGHLQTLVFVHEKLGRARDLKSFGTLRLRISLLRKLRLSEDLPWEINDAYTKHVLQPVAQREQFTSPKMLLAALAVHPGGIPDGYVDHRQDRLLKILMEQTRQYGAGLLEDTPFPNEPASVSGVLHELSTNAAIDVTDIAVLQLAMGMGKISTQQVLDAASQTLEDSIPTSVRPSALQPDSHTGPAYVKIEPPIVTVTDAGYAIDIKTDADLNQPGIFATFAPLITRHHSRLMNGTRSLREKTAHLRLVIRKTRKLNLELLKEDLVKTRILRRAPSPSKKRLFNVHIKVKDSGPVFDSFVQQVDRALPDAYFTWAALDSDAKLQNVLWLNFTLAIPETPGAASSDQDLPLRNFLETWRNDERLAPLIGPIQIHRTYASRATAARCLQLVKDKLQSINQEEAYRASLTIQHILQFATRVFGNLRKEAKEDQVSLEDSDGEFDRDDGDPNEVDEEVVKAFAKSLELGERFHSYRSGNQIVHQRRENGERYFTHPLAVTIETISAGFREPASWISGGSLHDSPEDGPENRWREDHPGQEPPSDDRDPRMNQYQEDLASYRAKLLSQIQNQAEFRDFEHSLMYMLRFMTNYGDVSELAGRGGIANTGAKLLDMTHNLQDVFTTYNRTEATQQIAKRVRGGLRLAAWETAIKNRPYRYPRRKFLRILMTQSNQLTDKEFTEPYFSRKEDPIKNRATVAAEMANTIDQYLAWAERNPDILPNDVRPEEWDKFMNRLGSLRDQLTPSIHSDGTRTARLPRHLWDDLKGRLEAAHQLGKLSDKAFQKIVGKSQGIARVTPVGTIEILSDAIPYLVDVLNHHIGRTRDHPFTPATVGRYLEALEERHLQTRAAPAVIVEAISRLKDPALYRGSPRIPNYDRLKHYFANNYGREFQDDALFVDELLSVFAADPRHLGQAVRVMENPDEPATSQIDLPPAVSAVLIELGQSLNAATVSPRKRRTLMPLPGKDPFAEDSYDSVLAKSDASLGPAPFQELIQEQIRLKGRVVYADVSPGYRFALRQARKLFGTDLVTYGVDLRDWFTADILPSAELQKKYQSLLGPDILDPAYDSRLVMETMETAKLPEPADLISFVYSLDYSGDPLAAIANFYNQLNPQGGQLVAAVNIHTLLGPPLQKASFVDIWVDLLRQGGIAARLTPDKEWLFLQRSDSRRLIFNFEPDVVRRSNSGKTFVVYRRTNTSAPPVELRDAAAPLRSEGTRKTRSNRLLFTSA